MSKHDIEGHVPPEAASDAANPPSGAPDSLERQLAKEREARQMIRERLRHTEALAAESHALRARMAEELERVTADRDRLQAEATIAAAISTPEPAAPRSSPAAESSPPAPADLRDLRDLRDRPAASSPTATAAAPTPGASAAPAARAAASPRAGRPAEPTMSPPPSRPRDDHPIGERPLKPPVRRGPWRALAMLGGLAVAVAGLAWLTGTMPSGLDVASLKPSVAEHGPGATPAASASGLALDTRAQAPAASMALAAATPSTATTPPPRGAVPLPPLTPEAQMAAAPTAAGLAPTSASTSASVPPPTTPATQLQAPARAQSQLRADGGLDVRLRKALDGEGIPSQVQIDPVSGHVLVADPQADRGLRDRTDMLIRAVYAGASLPEPQIEHRWMSPMRGDHGDALQAQAQAAAPTGSARGSARLPSRSRTQAQGPVPAPGSQRELASTTQPGLAAAERIKVSPPGAGVPMRHVEAGRPVLSTADAEDLRPVVPAGRITAGCMQDISGHSSNRRAALSACMKHSCCSSAGNLNSDECRAYQKAYPYTCGAG